MTDWLRQSKPPFDVVITDLKMPGLSGLDLVDQLHAAKPRLPIILMTAYGTTKTAIDATRLGAYEYVLETIRYDQAACLVAKALACDRLTSGLLELGTADSSPAGHRRPQPRDADSLQGDWAGWAGLDECPHPRRDRDGQGTGGAGHPPAQQPRELRIEYSGAMYDVMSRVTGGRRFSWIYVE